MNVSQIPSATKTRIVWLDSLRGISCLLVMILHYYHHILLELVPLSPMGSTAIREELAQKALFCYTIDFYEHTGFLKSQLQNLTPFFYGFWDLGKVGVIAFFLISGYIITYTLRHTSGKPIKTFIINRCFRLYPLFWFALALMILFKAFQGVFYSAWQVFINFTMFNGFFFVKDINGVAWTMQIEITFYILVMLYFVWGKFQKPRWIISSIYASLGLSLLMAIVKYQTGLSLPLALPLGLAMTFTGWCFRLRHETPDLISRTKLAMILLSFLPAWWVIFHIGYDRPILYFNSYLGGLLLVLGFIAFKVHNRVLKFFGEISYSIYLIHDVIGKAVIPALMTPALPLFKAHLELTLIPYFATILLTIGTSALLYHYIEKPCIEMGKTLIKRTVSQPAKPTLAELK